MNGAACGIYPPIQDFVSGEKEFPLGFFISFLAGGIILMIYMRNLESRVAPVVYCILYHNIQHARERVTDRGQGYRSDPVRTVHRDCTAEWFADKLLETRP